jgi:hypothetical protein
MDCPGDFGPALEQFLGTGAGLSAASITRLTAQWHDEAHAFGKRDLSSTDYVGVDGIHAVTRTARTLVSSHLSPDTSVRVDSTPGQAR